MSDDESKPLKTLAVEIEPEKFDLLNELLDFGEKSAAIRTYVDAIIELGGYDKRTAYDLELERLKRKAEEKELERERTHAEAERARANVAEARERRNNMRTDQERYEDQLAGVERPLRSGDQRYFPAHATIKSLAADFGKQPTHVLDDLRERNPDLPDHAFMDGTATTREWRGLPEGKIDTPPEDREDV